MSFSMVYPNQNVNTNNLKCIKSRHSVLNVTETLHVQFGQGICTRNVKATKTLGKNERKKYTHTGVLF